MIKATLIGNEQIMNALRELSRQSPSVISAGLRAAGGVVTKTVKQAMPTKLRTAVGGRFSKATDSNSRIYKIGAAVGKMTAARKRSIANKAAKRKVGRGGVGISTNNIHWWLLGTKGRTTRAGAWRGIMPGQRQLIPTAWAQSRTAALNAMRAAVQKQLEKKASQLKGR